MPNKSKGALVALIIFILNILIVCPIGYVVTENIRDQKEFRDTVTGWFIDQAASDSELKETNEYQNAEIDHLRNRTTRLENQIYELSNRN